MSKKALITGATGSTGRAAVRAAIAWSGTDGPFMAGSQFSLADVAGSTVIRAYQKDVDWSAERPLVQWFERVGGRPGVRHGLEAFRKS